MDTDEELITEDTYSLHNAAEVGDLNTLQRILSRRAAREGSTDNDNDFNPDELSEEVEDDNNIEIDLRDLSGCTALHLAIMSGSLDCVRLLLEEGADVTKLLESSYPLHLAVEYSTAVRDLHAIELVSTLLEYGADVEATDDCGRTPLHLAAKNGSIALVSLLIDKGGKTMCEHTDREGSTALHIASAHGQVEVVRHMTQKCGSVVDVQNKAGNTPLHLAARAGAAESARCLLATGASLAMLNNLKLTPGMLASRRGHQITELNCSPLPSGLEYTPTLILAPMECNRHFTAKSNLKSSAQPPPENVDRLRVLLDRTTGILRSQEFASDNKNNNTRALEIREQVRPASLTDVLRVHEWTYVKSVKDLCLSLPSGDLGHLDSDTVVSKGSYQAALHAAGAVCEAIDAVISGTNRNAFCAVRPPGHHAGPHGKVPSTDDPLGGSQGFCIFSNAAIGAAYARCVHRHNGISRVAIIDFDVHHGNGTQAVIKNCLPSMYKIALNNLLFDGQVRVPMCKPWLDENDAENIFFASVHGYDGRFYPGSGETGHSQGIQLCEGAELSKWYEDGVIFDEGDSNVSEGSPHILNVGMVGKGNKRNRGASWRRVWGGLVLPKLRTFDPDLIVVSAGFDAHSKDDIQGDINLGVRESDYEWLTDELVKVANSCCKGRLVSVLEGGYRIQGGLVSAFARSVAEHVRALQRCNMDTWSLDETVATINRERIEKWQWQQQTHQFQNHFQEHKLQGSPLSNAITTEKTRDTNSEVHNFDHCRKRRRSERVDYLALNTQLEMEAAVHDRRQHPEDTKH
mmetsp:Transcript_5861/g.20432  ORF Transcript_5861/g.20432 Transcript_5861/m.20432 type:complete len:800 (+) Transcript_5861:169-2568(+)|eukprot:CAMPEP_0183790058 /NCGR_PEP_ID=MMETSP0803_2-20130417/783_1 /TAXON_ID=195967 /ORGANISM="Crustomastix stigmata, Strain CCMP3273" /LENGTH=799 /DNA_ID=CAMNT_0026034247 /DNA_START=80 /DNA_END=2479 /DNA_ORIENTATION=+